MAKNNMTQIFLWIFWDFRSTCLDFRNAVLWDGHSQANKYIHFCKIKIGWNFPLDLFKFSFYMQKGGALQGKYIYYHNHFIYLFVGPNTATFSSPYRRSEKSYFWTILYYICIILLSFCNFQYVTGFKRIAQIKTQVIQFKTFKLFAMK